MALATGCPTTTGTPGPEAEPDAGTQEPDSVVFGQSMGIDACDDETVAAYPNHRCFSYRGVAGVSMGGGTAARLGFNHPELFDVVGIMGTPFADTRFFWGMLENEFMSGFCPLEQLEAAMALDPDSLNDPTNPDIWCGTHDVWPMAQSGEQVSNLWPAHPDSECYLFKSDYNHWYRGPDAGRGGSFHRNSLIEILHDYVMAFGNPLYHNPDNNYFPPGVPDTRHVSPNDDAARASFCETPVVLENFYNKEYNPQGTYPVITFCEGVGDGSGDYDPTSNRAFENVIEYAVAVDLNGNGIRDYGEPVVVNNKERYQDTGTDGLFNEDEPGYDPVTNPDPNGDDFDPLTNHTGTEHNLTYDEGETYEDFGLDGVDGTGDFGEGNGSHDISPGLARYYERSPTDLFKAVTDDQAKRLDVWIDAGIRDFLNTAQISNALYSVLAERMEGKIFQDFSGMPGLPPDEGYVYFNADYSRSAMGQLSYLQYGDPAFCPNTDDILGDGNHVGQDVVHRLFTLFSFMSARMPAEGRDQSFGGTITDLESPTGQLTDFGYMVEYDSEVLGRKVEYGITLPPDYYLSDKQDERYPVLYFFHGQGMDAQGTMATGYALFGSMQGSSRPDRLENGLTDFQRAIIVWVDGECKSDECWTGTFYADFEGLPRQDRNYGQAFIEVMKHVDENYRTKKPRLVPLDEVPE